MNPPVESRISANPLGCKAPALAMALLCFLGLGVRRANAAGYTWDANTSSAVITDGTGIWSTSANDWVTAGVESAWLGGDAQIGGAGLTGTNSISLSGNISVGNLYIAPNTSGTITDDASDALTISGSMTAGHAFTISGPVFFTDGLLNSSTVTIGGVTTSSGNSTITISGSVNVTGGGISESDSNGGVTINGPEVGATSIAVTNGTLTMSGSVAALSGGISVANGNLTLSGTTEGAASITITSGNLTLSGSNAALSGTIGISGGTLNMNGIYASNFATNITQSNGTLEVNGTTFPTFTGTWGMSGGTLQVGGGAFTTAIGTGAGQLNITGNVTLAISGNQTGTFNFGSGEMLTWGTGGFNPGNTLTLNPNNQSTMTFANSIDLNGATRTIQDQANGYGTGDLILSGTLQNSGAAANLIITMSNQRSQGDNWVELTGSNTYTGTTFIAGSTATTGNNNPMRLVLDASGSFSSATYYITGTDGGQLQIMPGTGSGGTTYVSGNITNTGTDNVTNPGGNAYTYDAGYVLIIGGTGTPNGLASGTGVVVLTGTNTYTGSTLIKSGTLQIGNGGTAGSLPSATGINSLANTALVYDVSTTGTLTGLLSGSMSFTQAGTGMTVLANGETYTGLTNITSGTLQLGNGTTDGSLSSGTINNAGTLVFNTNTSLNYAGQISGNGTVTMSGAGNQKLSGANNYSGPTNVNSGTLQLGSASALGSTSTLTIAGGGSLNLSYGAATHTTTLSGAGQSLVLNNGATLDFGVGSATADQLILTGGATTTVTGTTYINLSLISGTGVSNYTIISDSTPFTLNSGTFVLGTLPSLTSGSLVQTGSTVSITISGLTTVYWKGTGTAGTSNWSDYTNFTSDAAGTQEINAQFGTAQAVVFSASSPSNESSSNVDYNAIAASLTINDPGAVSIDSSTGKSLTLASSGITTGAGAGTSGTAPVIGNATSTLDLILSGTPNITANNADGLRIGAVISDSNGIILNGTTIVYLDGTGNTYTGGTVLDSGTLNIVADNNLGASGAGNGVTFQAGSGSATLQSGTTTLSTAANRAFVFSSGTGIIDPGVAGDVMNIQGAISGTGVLELVDSGQLFLSGSVAAFSGTANVNSGTLTVASPANLAQLSGTTVFNIAPGGVVQLNGSSSLNVMPVSGAGITFTGSGTLQKIGSGTMQFHNGNGPINMDMTGGVVEIVAGLWQDGGNGNNGHVSWTNNLASLQIDGGAAFDLFDGSIVDVNVLLGSGTLTRSGYSTGNVNPQGLVIGDNNGSGTFAGVITNAFGQVNLTKEGSGLQVFTGSNSYSGSTAITGGTLRITNGAGLGFGDQTFVTQGGQHTTYVSGAGSTLDINNGITVNTSLTLNNGGSLINSAAGTTSVFNSGIAGITFTSDNATGATGTNSLMVTFGSGNAQATAGTVSGFAGGSSDNLYVQMTSAGSGYTQATAPTVTIQGGIGGTVTAVVSSIALTGTGDTLGGNGNLLVNAQITGTGGFSTTGTGTVILSSSETYTGTTNVNTGNLEINGYLTSPVSINATGGVATLSGAGILNGPVTTAPAVGTAHIAPGVNTSGNFGGIGTLTLNSGLTLGNGTNLDFDLGASSDLIAVTGQLTLGTGVVLNVSQAAGFSVNTTYTLITYTGALTGNASTWTATGVAPATAATFNSAGNAVTVVFTPINVPGNAYWGGAYGSGGNGTWNTFANGSSDNTNWLSAITGGTDTLQVPFAGTNVFFIADTGSNTNTYLGANFTINSLNFTGTDATVTTGSAVTISGSIPSNGSNYSLTINATNASGNTAGSGITTGPGTGADIINANVVLGGNQTWTLNAAPSSPLTVNGVISGSHALALSGSGGLVLGGNNTFTNGLTINGSVNVVLNNPGALNSTSPDSVTFGASSSGTINLNGNNIAFGSLSTNATPGAPVIQNNSSTPVTLTIDQAISGTYAGAILNGGSGSLSLTLGGPAALTLAGSNTYTGSTTINGGDLLVNTSIGAGNVTVNSSGTLGGSGTIGGAVTITTGGRIAPTLGTANSPATLTLTSSGGLTIQSGGIAAFNIINGGANDEINITNGDLTLATGAILQVSPYLTNSGTYALVTYTGTNPSLAGITGQDLGGGALQTNYSFTAASGTLDLVVTSSTEAIASVTISSPSPGGRVMSGTFLVVSGSVLNPGNTNTLSGTLSNGGGSLTVGNLNPGVASVAAGGADAFSGTIASTGVTLGNQTFGVTVTDGASINTSATATETVDVVTNRVVTGSVALSTGSTSVGVVHVGSAVSGTVTLTSPGADNQYTRVTVAGSGTDAFGISATGGNSSGTYNGSFSDTRIISGIFAMSGSDAGITLVTTGEGLAGESPQNVLVSLNATVFSGHASWIGNGGNSSWSTNSNWGDTNPGSLGVIGAPGLSGALSIGDTATFTDYSGETVGGTTTINLNGVTPTLAGLTFSSANTTFNIATGSGSGTLAIQNNATMSVTTGTGEISANISGTGALTVAGSAGTDLIWGGNDAAFTGSANINSGTLTLSAAATLAQTSGTTVFNIASGGVLQLSGTGNTNLEPVTGAGITFTGSGTLQKIGSGTLQFHNANGPINMDMTGGVVEVVSGLFSNGGNGNNGHVNWAGNLASLQIDAGASFDIFDGNTVIVDALLGSGTLTRSGYGTGNDTQQNLVIGVNNGSGTFAGVITNAFGQIGIVKEGTGLQVFSGSNSYSGSTAVTGGTLRITNGGSLGFGDRTFVTGANGGLQHTTYVSGAGSTLDISNGITVNTSLTLNNGGSLINSAAGTTSVFDSGIAGITFTSDNATGATGTNSLTVTFGSGNAQATAGTVSGFAGGGADNLYVQMTSAGSGYTPGAAPTVTIQGGVGGTVAAVVSSIALTGTGDTLGGNGNLLINAQITGTGGFTTVGTGTVELTNNELYTGATTLGAGSTLELGTGYSSVGSIGGAGSVVVAGSGTQIFAGLETYAGSTTINAGSTLQMGNGVTDGSITNSSAVIVNGALAFATAGNQNFSAFITGTGTVTMNGAGNQELSGNNNYMGATTVNSGTLQLGSATALGNTSGVTVSGSGSLNVSNGLTPQTITMSGSGQVLALNNGASLDFGVTNTGNDELVISGSAVTAVNGIITINLSLISGTGQGSTPFTIISDASGGLNNATFVLGNVPSLATTSITQTSTEVQVTLSSTISVVYWSGNGSNSPGFWSDVSNFTSDAAGTTPLTGTFGSYQDLVFSGSGAINQNSSLLNYNAIAHSLTINDPAGVIITGFGGTLTLTGTTGTTGINMGAAAGVTQAQIGANVDLAGTSNVTVDNTGGLLISGAISGASGLIVNGADTLSLTGVNNYTGGTQLISGTLNVNSDSAFGTSGPGDGVTFNPGAGNSVTLQAGANGITTAGNRAFVFASGTGIIDPGPAGNVFTIGGPVTGATALQVIDTGELVLSGSVAFNGNAYVSSGTLALTYPGTLGQTGSSVFNTAPGGTLLLNNTTGQNLAPTAGSVTFTGNGTLLIAGSGFLEMHNDGGGNINMDMSGGTIEVSGGLFQDGGGAGSGAIGDPAQAFGSATWTNNFAALQLDSGASFDPWDGNNPQFSALLGSGTLTRLGYGDGENSIITLGVNNGSGTFSGVITNQYGTNSIVKTGTGIQVFGGNNSYSGSTGITGGTLRITSNTGLGFGGSEYIGAAAATATVSGASTLDMNGNITVDKAITLSGGSLINSGAGTTALLDNGIAAIALGGTQVGNYTSPGITPTGGNGSGATFGAGSGTAPGGTNVYGYIVTPGTGYTVAPTLGFTDSNSGTGSGVTATAILSSLTLSGTNDIIGGNGNLTINAQISGTSGFSTTGTGILTLTGSETYAGATTLAGGGVLVNNGTITGLVNVNPNTNAAATLSGTGVFDGLVSTAAASGSNIAHIAPGVNTSGNFGGIGTLTLKNGLTIGNGTNLDFDLGTNSDLLAVTGALSLGNGVTLNVNQVAGFAPGTYTLITYTGALTGNTTGWVATGVPGENATFASGGGVVTLTLAVGANNSQLAITPSPISLGSVLVGFTPSTASGTLGNTSSNGSSADYTTVATGSASVSPANGTLGANGTTALTVGASSPINLTSGNNQVIGTVYATNSSNSSGSAAPVNVTANVFQAFTGTTPTSTSGANSAALTLTDLASTDGGQRAGVSLTGFSVGNPNFAITGSGSVGIANGSNVTATVGTVTTAASDLNGSYSYTGSVTGTAQYTDPALALQAGVSNQTWSNVTLTATVTGQTSNARTNVFSAQIQSGSSYAGYSLSSSVMVGGIQQHPNTGSGGTTTATLLAGTASATTTVDMSFDSSPVSGPDNSFRTSDILTLTGINPTGTTTWKALTVTLTDQYVLQLSYDTSAAGLEYIAQNATNGWLNAVTFNSDAGVGATLYANETYATYVAGTTDGDTPALGAYGYDAGVAWAVLNHTSVSDPVSEFAVIPEPDTYAMIFSGFGMLIGFRRLRRRHAQVIGRAFGLFRIARAKI